MGNFRAAWVFINTEDGRYNFNSPFDRNVTTVPGITSRVVYNRISTEAATIRLERANLFSFFCPEGQYLVEDREGKYLGFADRQCVFAMKRTSPGAQIPAAVRKEYSYFDVKPYFTVTTAPEIPLPTAAILTAFPMLRFG